MRVAIWHNLPSGGARRVLHDHVTGLLTAGHAIEVFCPPTADLEYMPLPESAREHVIPLPLGQVSRSVRRVFDFTRAKVATLEKIAAMETHARLVGEAVNGGGFDLFMANSCRWFNTPFVGRHVRVPSIVYLQEPCRWLYEAMPQLPWLAEREPSNVSTAKFVRQWLGSAVRVHPIRRQAAEELTSITAFDRVLVNSRFSRESVLRAFGVDSQVCYPGIDQQVFCESGVARENFVLSVGEFARHKNPLFVVNAVARTKHKPRLIWACNRVDEGLLAEARAIASTHQVELDVRLKVSQSELTRLYQTARLFLYAARLEPLGLVPLEAAACGTPTVGVAEGGIRETVIDQVTGILVDGSPEAMAAAVDALLNDNARSVELGRAAARHVSTAWSMEDAIRRLEEQMRSVAHGADQTR